MTLAPHRPPFHDHPFSIASGPTELPKLRLVVGEAGDCTNGFGRIAPGTRVAVDGPHGSFILPEAKGPVVMIAGGVGVAPLLGILEEAAAERDERRFHLLYAARKSSELADLQRLRELQSRLDLSFRFIVDEIADESGYTAGPLKDEHVAETLKGAQPADVIALVCGPAGMMELATDTLLAAGVPMSSIVYERFDYAAGRGRLDRQRRRQSLVIFIALVAAMAGFSLR
jgi:ferredoxin-NADP reductase